MDADRALYNQYSVTVSKVVVVFSLEMRDSSNYAIPRTTKC